MTPMARLDSFVASLKAAEEISIPDDMDALLSNALDASDRAEGEEVEAWAAKLGADIARADEVGSRCYREADYRPQRKDAPRRTPQSDPRQTPGVGAWAYPSEPYPDARARNNGQADRAAEPFGANPR